MWPTIRVVFLDVLAFYAVDSRFHVIMRQPHRGELCTYGAESCNISFFFFFASVFLSLLSSSSSMVVIVVAIYALSPAMAEKSTVLATYHKQAQPHSIVNFHM